MENIKLNNGKYLNREYGKYKPNLTFLSNTPLEKLEWEHIDPIKTFNCDFDGKVFILKGKYWKNKKGTNIFDLTQKGDVLIKVSWRGAFNDTKGGEYLDKNHEAVRYYRRASSNGGGVVNTYFVVKDGFKLEIGEDDI